MVDISAVDLDTGSYTPPVSKPQKPKFCITELSVVALVAAVFAISVVLWLAILAVL